MTVKIFAYLRDADFAGCKELEWPAAEDVFQLGRQLSDRFGEKFRGEFFTPDGSDLGERIIVLVNGRRTTFLDGVRTRLKPDDVVQIFPVVAGG